MTDAIRLSPDDNVATVLHEVRAGDTLEIRCGEALTTIEAAQAIPLCHKISLAPIAAGDAVIKYGQKIGESLAAIPPGHHVHVHNMPSARARASV
jgi:altronate dehydratase